MIKKILGGLTVLLGFALVLIIIQPLGASSQFFIAAAALSLMILIRILDLKGYFRGLFFIIGGALILRYVHWRATTTLPSIESLSDFIPGIVLFSAEMFCIFMFTLNIFVILRPLDRKRAPAVSIDDAPTVDVFIPTLNEDPSLLAATLSAAKSMDYPKGRIQVYLLDDGGTDEKVQSEDPDVAEEASARRRELQLLCGELGVNYVTRERNLHAKAGNLTNGLKHSAGEYVVIFDADHAPAREFLRETIGHFLEDEKLFLVQTPHFFVNPDPIEKNLSTFTRMPSENEMFYSMIQKGLDKWNAAFFCGSAAVLRRQALEEAGGFSGTSITEDCETALDIHARGWRSLYVDKPMVAGLQPETLASFIGQRSRWCRGMLQILLMKNPLFKRGLTSAQKACYLSSSMFWLFPLPRTVFLVAPLLYIFFSVEIYNATVEDFFAYTIAYLVAALVIQSYAYGRFRWPWMSERYEYVQSVYLLPAILSVIRNPRKPTFNVTAKGATTDRDQLSVLAWPYFVIFAVLFAGVIVTGLRLEADPDSQGLLLIVGTWNLFNLVIAGVALGVVSERREQRSAQRLPTSFKGALAIEDLVVPVRIEDVSLGGLRLRPVARNAPAIPLNRKGKLVIEHEEGKAPHIVEISAVNVADSDTGRFYGVAFASLKGSDYPVLANMMYGDMGRLRKLREARQRVRGIIASTIRIIGWGARESARGFYFLLFRRSTKPQPASS